MEHKQTVIIYHGKCPDGFGAAYAAWKKFGDGADYLAADHGDPPPAGLDGREVYLVDFCYENAEQMQELAQTAKRLVVLDHHQSDKELIEAAPEHIYDANRSGASIAWAYFHPDKPLPWLIRYLEDGDLYRHALPETHDFYSYLFALPYEFSAWDELNAKLENDEARAQILDRGKAYSELIEALAQRSVARAKKVRFEGYEVYFVATHPDITFKSYVASLLYKKHPPFAIIVTAHPNGYGVSLRGDGSVDVAAIAAKYGGGGHQGSAGLFIPNSSEMPWTEIETPTD